MASQGRLVLARVWLDLSGGLRHETSGRRVNVMTVTKRHVVSLPVALATRLSTGQDTRKDPGDGVQLLC
jgi:hypothetical protein